jgi:hypothetical protein
MKYYDLYGTRTMSTDELQRAVALVLGVSFQARYSDEIGSYFNADVDQENFSVERNFLDDGDEDDIQEAEFADWPALLFVNRTERGNEIRGMLLEIPGLEHLRRDTRG